MVTVLIPYLHDLPNSRTFPRLGHCVLKFGKKICLLFAFSFLLQAHTPVEGRTPESAPKKDVLSFWREGNTVNSSISRESGVRFREGKQLLKNKEVSNGCGKDLEVCPGNRPRSRKNCTCRALAWEECGYEIGKDCDELLGLRCMNNTCKGQYRLKVMSVSRNSIRLSWNDFKPTVYLYEYVLLRSFRFYENINFWQSESIGNQPKTLVDGLAANRGYFFRVATWEDPRFNKYRNISEAVFVMTKAGCFYENKWYDVGQILRIKCEEKCRCLANGSFNCEELCPEEKPLPDMNDPNLKCFKELTKSSECCYKITCIPVDGSCAVNESRVADGEVFNTKCSQCACKAGRLNCTNKETCPPKPPDLLCENPVQNATTGSCCPPWHCHDTCPYKNKSQTQSKMFYSPDCKICICRWNGQKVCHHLFCPDIPKLTANPICLDPQIHPGQCCPVLYCHKPSTVSLNAIQNLTAKVKGSNSMLLTFRLPPNGHLLNYTNGYDVQYRRQSKASQAGWTTTQSMTLKEKPDPKSLTTVDVNDLEANVTYLYRVRIHLDWEKAKLLFGEVGEGTTALGPEERMAVTSDLTESIPLAETNVPPESIIPFSAVVSAKTSFQAADCLYKKKRIKLGEVIENSCKNYCDCQKSGISCRPVCSLTVKKPRENCLTTHLPIDCCPSWICQPERREYSAVSTSACFELEGPCQLPHRKFADDVIEVIRTRAEEGSSRVCGGTTTGCVNVHVQVTCANKTGNTTNGAKHRPNVRVCIKWRVRRKLSRAFDVIAKELKMFVNGIDRQFVAKDFRILIQGIPYGPIQNWHLSSLTEECDEGFNKHDSDCVEMYPIYNSSPGRINLKFHVEEITDFSAILNWQPLTQQEGQYRGNISIAYREAENLGNWVWSKSLNASTVSYVLSYLLPGQKYIAEMVWQAKMFGIETSLATAEFSTKVTPGIQPRGMSIMVKNNDLHEIFLLVKWERPPPEILQRLKTLKLVYQKPDTQTWCTVIVSDPAVTDSQKIENIKRPGNYTVRLSIHLKNGKKINILPTHIRIIQAMSSHSKRSGVVVGIVVSVCVGVILTFSAVIVWRRRSRRCSSSNGYENKAFGLQLTESQKSNTSHLNA